MTRDRICAWLQCNQVNAAYAQYYVYEVELQLAGAAGAVVAAAGGTISHQTTPHSSPPPTSTPTTFVVVVFSPVFRILVAHSLTNS